MAPAQGKAPRDLERAPLSPAVPRGTPPPPLCVTLSLALPFSVAAESWIPKHSTVSFGVL